MKKTGLIGQYFREGRKDVSEDNTAPMQSPPSHKFGFHEVNATI